MAVAAAAGARTLVVTAAVGKEVVLVVTTVRCRRSIPLMARRCCAPFRRHRYHPCLHRIDRCDHRRRILWRSRGCLRRLLRRAHGWRRSRHFRRSPPAARKSFTRQWARWNSLSGRRQRRHRRWNGPEEGKRSHKHLRRQEVVPQVFVFHRGHRALESRFLIEEKETCRT